MIAEGEVLQLMNMHDASLDEAGYLRVIRSKTAKLFEASTRLAAVLAGSPAEVEEACATYGQALGTAFQVIDDVLDYDGSAAEMGKNLGDDLREGKATLPLIAAMQRGSRDEAAVIRDAIENGSVEALDAIVGIVRDTGSLDEAAYLRVIRSKTAKLFEASTRLAAILAKSSPNVESACAEYGQALGTAFQVIDDVLDYDGDAKELGKNLGDDLREGKNTLPLIIAMQRGTPAQRQTIQSAIENGEMDALAEIVDIVRSTGALEATRAAASAEAERAIAALNILPSSPYRDAMHALAAQLLDRRN